MKDKTLGTGLILTIVLAVIGAFFEPIDYVFAEFIYMIAGLGFLFFGIWAGVRLLK